MISSLGFFIGSEVGIVKFSSEFFATYRPDLWAHFVFGYAINKFWRLTYKTRGLFRNVVADFLLSLVVHISKEIVDVARAQSILRFDFVDIVAALLGLLAEDIKYTVQTKYRRNVISKA